MAQLTAQARGFVEKLDDEVILQGQQRIKASNFNIQLLELRSYPLLKEFC